MSDKTPPPPAPPRLDGFALVLGASSGFGARCSVALAEAGMDIIGVHLDRRSTLEQVAAVMTRVRDHGREAWFYNVNAADETKRRATLEDIVKRLAERGGGSTVRVLLHSLAFGTLRPALGTPEAPDDQLTKMQVEMTLDVMAHSLLYWTQDLLRLGMLRPHGRVFAMTSEGGRSALPHYGAVSAAKAALEAHVRQLALEGARRGFTANALCAGVTRTPALEKIPGHEELVARAIARNPHGRLTTPDDVARALVPLCDPGTDWLSGNVIHIDGGEGAAG